MKNLISLNRSGMSPDGMSRKGRYSLYPILSRLCLASLICLCMLTLGVGNAWGADPVATATATSGKSYVIAYWNGSKYIALDPAKVSTSASTFEGTDVTVDANGKVTTANPPLWTLTVNPSNSNQFYISCKISSTTYYLYKNGTSSTTNYNIKRVASGQHYWTFSKSSNKYSIKSERGSACQYLYYYNNGGKWEVYSSSTASLLLLEPAPTITCATSSLSGFTYVQGSGPSAAQSFSVSGSYLTANITVTAPTNYEVSTSSGSGYGNSVTLTKNASGVVSATTIYVRLKSGLSAGTYNSENVTISTTGAANKTISLSGSVTAPACANSVTINKGTSTNCSFSLSPSGSQPSCSSVTTTISITPTTGYGTPVVSESGASSTPTKGGSGNSQTLTYAANTTGTSTIAVSCSANNYTINLDKDLTPTSAGTASIAVTFDDDNNLDGTPAITPPTKTGWTFAGYFTAKNGGGVQIIDASGNVIASAAGGGNTYTDGSKKWKYAGNITLYAKWTCTVTWSVNGATNVYSTQTVTYNSSGSKVASIPGPPSPASYCGNKFVGWTTEENVSQNDDTGLGLFTTVGDSPDIKSIGNITFYAVFADYDE